MLPLYQVIAFNMCIREDTLQFCISISHHPYCIDQHITSSNHKIIEALKPFSCCFLQIYERSALRFWLAVELDEVK